MALFIGKPGRCHAQPQVEPPQTLARNVYNYYLEYLDTQYDIATEGYTPRNVMNVPVRQDLTCKDNWWRLDYRRIMQDELKEFDRILDELRSGTLTEKETVAAKERLYRTAQNCAIAIVHDYLLYAFSYEYRFVLHRLAGHGVPLGRIIGNPYHPNRVWFVHLRPWKWWTKPAFIEGQRRMQWLGQKVDIAYEYAEMAKQYNERMRRLGKKDGGR